MAKPKKSAVSFKNRLETTFKTMPSDMLRVGFSSLDMWVSMNNFAMNRINSGRFDTAWLFGRNYLLFGESGSGKSLFAAMIAAEAQRTHKALVVWLDSEHATDDEIGKRWLQRAGIDLDNLVYISLASLEETKRTIAEISAEIRANYGVDDGKDYQPVVVVCDSWATLQTEAQLERTRKGELVGDMGQKAKQTGEVLTSSNHLCAGLPLMILGIQHVMDNQDGFGRKHKTTGGNKMIFLASGCMLYTKRELKMEDVDDPEMLAKLREVTADWSQNLKKEVGIGKDGPIVGISIIVENLKSRYAKPFQRLEVQVPYRFGVDAYSGLFGLLLLEQAIWPGSVGWFEYDDKEKAPLDAESGKHLVKFRKGDFRTHADRIMALQPSDLSDPEASERAVAALMAEPDQTSEETPPAEVVATKLKRTPKTVEA